MVESDREDTLKVRQRFRKFFICDGCGTPCYFCVTNDFGSLPKPVKCPYNPRSEYSAKPNWRLLYDSSSSRSKPFKKHIEWLKTHGFEPDGERWKNGNLIVEGGGRKWFANIASYSGDASSSPSEAIESLRTFLHTTFSDSDKKTAGHGRREKPLELQKQVDVVHFPEEKPSA